MARIRSIKPEFWTSEQVVECSTNARLLFIGLWNFCDDHGRHTFAPKQIKALVFPADDFSSADVGGMLEELVSAKLIRKYEVNDKCYLEVTGWHHQKIDKRQDPRFPAPAPNGSGQLGERSPIVRLAVATEGNTEKNRKDIPLSLVDPAREKEGGGEDKFEKFKGAYPKIDKGSVKEAKIVFLGFVESDQTWAVAGASGYAAEFIKNPTSHSRSPVKFLKERVFEGYASADGQVPLSTSFAAVGSPEWVAGVAAGHKPSLRTTGYANGKMVEGWGFPIAPSHERSLGSG